RERKNNHDHPARAFGLDKTVTGALQMPEEIAVKFGLGVPVVANRVVKLGQAFSLHDVAQPADESKGTSGVDAEVSARVREEDREISLTEEKRVQCDAGFVGVEDAKRERP